MRNGVLNGDWGSRLPVAKWQFGGFRYSLGFSNKLVVQKDLLDNIILWSYCIACENAETLGVHFIDYNSTTVPSTAKVNIEH